MSEPFNPVEAMNSLREWAIKLEQIGKKKVQAQIEYNRAQIKLEEKEQEARELIFTGKQELQASRQRDWIKWYCSKEELEANRKKNAYKEIETEYGTIDRLISVTQTATKLAEAEMRNLNL